MVCGLWLSPRVRGTWSQDSKTVRTAQKESATDCTSSPASWTPVRLSCIGLERWRNDSGKESIQHPGTFQSGVCVSDAHFSTAFDFPGKGTVLRCPPPKKKELTNESIMKSSLGTLSQLS